METLAAGELVDVVAAAVELAGAADILVNVASRSGLRNKPAGCWDFISLSQDSQ